MDSSTRYYGSGSGVGLVNLALEKPARVVATKSFEGFTVVPIYGNTITVPRAGLVT